MVQRLLSVTLQRLLSVTLLMLSVDVLVLQAAREVSYSARNFTHITSAASHILGRPGPGEPSGFLVVPGQAEGVACGAAHALRASTSAPLLAPPHPRSPTPPARSPPFASRAPLLTPLPLSLSSPISQPTSAWSPAALARPQRPLTASRRAKSTAVATRRLRPPPVSQLRQHLLANARAASHILGRPGPGEPSGFPVVPGRAEGVAEGEAKGAGLSR